MSLIQRPFAPAGILGRDSLRKIGEYDDAFTYTQPCPSLPRGGASPVPQTASSPTLCANGPPIHISSHAPLPIVWAHPSVEGEPIEVTDPPKETRVVHNQLQNVHTGGEVDAWNIDGLPNLPVTRSK